MVHCLPSDTRARARARAEAGAVVHSRGPSPRALRCAVLPVATTLLHRHGAPCVRGCESGGRLPKKRAVIGESRHHRATMGVGRRRRARLSAARHAGRRDSAGGGRCDNRQYARGGGTHTPTTLELELAACSNAFERCNVRTTTAAAFGARIQRLTMSATLAEPRTSARSRAGQGGARGTRAAPRAAAEEEEEEEDGDEDGVETAKARGWGDRRQGAEGLSAARLACRATCALRASDRPCVRSAWLARARGGYSRVPVARTARHSSQLSNPQLLLRPRAARRATPPPTAAPNRPPSCPRGVSTARCHLIETSLPFERTLTDRV